MKKEIYCSKCDKVMATIEKDNFTEDDINMYLSTIFCPLCGGVIMECRDVQ